MVARREDSVGFLVALCIIPLILCFSPASSSVPASALNGLPTSVPPPRSPQPAACPALHILFVLSLASYTHIAAPIEYLLELKRRGHRVSWQQPRYLIRMFRDEDERLSLPFNFSLVDVDENGQAAAVRLMTERPFLEVFDEVSRVSYEPVYPVLYRAMMEAVVKDRPDVVMCDTFADHCVDIASQLQLPAVIVHCTTPLDEYSPWHFDTPSSLTTLSQHWHEQPLWRRLYNTYGVLFEQVRYGAAPLARIQAMKAALGAPISFSGIASWQGKDVLYDSSWAWEWPLYWPPNAHMVGPIPKTWRRQSEQLDAALQRWLDDAARESIPVAYVAMGGLVSLTDRWLQTFAAAFSECRAVPLRQATTNQTSLFRVLWANRDSPQWLAASLAPSVRVEQWVNQPAVLAHPAVRVFVSHCGMASVQEAVAVGLPILALPLMFDQLAIASKLRDRGVADVLDKLSSTADDVCAGMRRLVFDPQVQLAAGKLQRLYHRPDGGGLQRAVDIIERAAVSQEHLIPYRERTDVSWLVRYNVDVYAVGVAVLMAVLAVCGVLVRLVVRAVWRGVAARADKSKVA